MTLLFAPPDLRAGFFIATPFRMISQKGHSMAYGCTPHLLICTIIAYGYGMAIKSTLTMLEEVQAAITALNSGAQSVTIDGISYSQSSIDALERREETLFRRLNQSNLRKRTTPDFG